MSPVQISDRRELMTDRLWREARSGVLGDAIKTLHDLEVRGLLPPDPGEAWLSGYAEGRFAGLVPVPAGALLIEDREAAVEAQGRLL